MRKSLFALLCIVIATPLLAGGNKVMEKALREYSEGKDARIGIAVIVNGKDTVAINGGQRFPMMSVFKFPLALAVADRTDSDGMSLNDAILFDVSALKEDTYSPMLKKYGKSRSAMTIKELLEWSLIESDNNAADILLEYVGGPSGVMSVLSRLGISDDISVSVSEDDMHQDQTLSVLNYSTPLAMARLFDLFYRKLKNTSKSYAAIASMLEQCRTGLDRLAAPLPAGATIAHKTGTGFDTPEGGITAVNDCGFVLLPGGTTYSIAVFISDSRRPASATSILIAEISAIVLNELYGHNADYQTNSLY